VSYLIIFVFTLVSCFLFDLIGVWPIVTKLTGSYKDQMMIMTDKQMSDEERQKKLLSLIPGQLTNLAKLIGAILLFISPFFIYILLSEYSDYFHLETLYSLLGIGASAVAVITYIWFKKRNGLHQN